MQKKVERITILIDASIKNRLAKAARYEDKTVSQLIRGLIRAHFHTVDSQSLQSESPT